MRDAFLFESEPFEFDGEFEDFESLDTELIDEGEEEARRFGRMPRRAVGSRMRPPPRGRLRQRPKGPPRGLRRRPRRPGPLGALIRPAYAEPLEHGSEYVRWVQSSLNQVLGLRLPVTGVMNAPTRSALRQFQERQGLRVDGIAGPETKTALIAEKRKSAGPSPAGASGAEPAASEPSAAEPSSSEPSSAEPDAGEPSEEPGQSQEFEWSGSDEFEWEAEQDPGGGVKRMLRMLGLKLSPQELRALLGGGKISLARRSLSELGSVLIRAERLYEIQNHTAQPTAGELEASSGNGKCKGCKGICIPVSDLNCICFGLLTVSYCRRFRSP